MYTVHTIDRAKQNERINQYKSYSNEKLEKMNTEQQKGQVTQTRYRLENIWNLSTGLNM